MSHIHLTQPVSSTRLLDDAGSGTLWFGDIEMQEGFAISGPEMGKEIPGGRSQRGYVGLATFGSHSHRRGREELNGSTYGILGALISVQAASGIARIPDFSAVLRGR